jgi:hypothetical protein
MPVTLQPKVGGWIEPGGVSQFGSGEHASSMELVEWSELGHRQRPRFGRGRRQRRLDAAGQASGSIVVAHFDEAIGHGYSPGKFVYWDTLVSPRSNLAIKAASASGCSLVVR